MSQVYESVLHIDVGSRAGAGWYANRYRVHQRLHMAFRDSTHGRLLFALVEPSGILVRHQAPADWEAAFATLPVLAQVRVRLLSPGFETGMQLRFMLEANPIRRDTSTRNRVPVNADRLDQWLERKMHDAGAEILDSHALRLPGVTSRASGDRSFTHMPVQFAGALRVLDPAALLRAYLGGIGPAKGFGFGMLRLR